MFKKIIYCIILMNNSIYSSEALKLPIVFHPSYDISFAGLENLHPFDSKKYGKVYSFLQRKFNLTDDNFYHPAGQVTDQELLKVHTPVYLDSLKVKWNNFWKSSIQLAQITAVPPLRFVPRIIADYVLLKPMRLATSGTVQAVELALQHGWAINLSGGYHHAKTGEGGGF